MKNFLEWHLDKCNFERGDFKTNLLFLCRQKTCAMNISLQFKLNGKDHQNENHMAEITI